MQITKDWLEKLAKKYGIKSKVIRDALWPTMPSKGLSYFDYTKNVGVRYIETIADILGCPVDEILRRPQPGSSQVIAGDNNQVGNVNINNDVESLHQIIAAQKQIIEHQDKEIERLDNNMKLQLKAKDQQIDSLNKKNDRLIQMLKDTGNQ